MMHTLQFVCLFFYCFECFCVNKKRLEALFYIRKEVSIYNTRYFRNVQEKKEKFYEKRKRNRGISEKPYEGF